MERPLRPLRGPYDTAARWRSRRFTLRDPSSLDLLCDCVHTIARVRTHHLKLNVASLKQVSGIILSKLRNYRPSLGAVVIVCLVLGVLTGLFFGDYCARLDLIGTAFVRLLQMTIIPYIMVSMIYGLGSLTYDLAKRLAGWGVLVLVGFMLLGMIVILLVPSMFPKMVSASFFNPDITRPEQKVDLLNQFLPGNIFEALVGNALPAVVLFSVLVGIALIGIKDKKPLLDVLDILSRSLMRVSQFIIKLTPIAVFAMTASAAGTMTVDELNRLQAYFNAYIVTALFMAFVLIPLVASAVTPFRYRDILAVSRDALITAFATKSLIIVLPLIINNCVKLFEKYREGREDATSVINSILPVVYNLPNLGKLLALVFVLFAAWYSGRPIPTDEFLSFGFIGTLVLFGAVNAALPFLMQLYEIPLELFDLFILSANVITGRFSVLVSCMHLTVLVIVITYFLESGIRFSARSLLRSALIIIGSGLILFTSVGFILDKTVNTAFDLGEQLMGMRIESAAESIVHEDLPIVDPVPVSEHRTEPIPKDPAVAARPLPTVQKRSFFSGFLPSARRKAAKTLDESLELVEDSIPPLTIESADERVIRVGFNPDRLPFSYFNDQGDLVGYDVDLAHRLARDLKCRLDFFPYEKGKFVDDLNARRFDLLISAVPMTPEGLDRMNFTDPYLELTFSVVVKREREKSFRKLDDIRVHPDLVLAVTHPIAAAFLAELQGALPYAAIDVLGSPKDFFENRNDRWDALIISAEAGSAWTLLYPDYAVVVPRPEIHQFTVGYALPKDEIPFTRFLNSWLRLNESKGITQELYDHWILGRDIQRQDRRWCIIRDVLHWVE